MVVVGGGVVGAGTALEAAARGLRVALVEKGDFANCTSSRSTKLIHGGVRYLEQAFKTLDYSMINLVTEALHERSHMLNSCSYMNKPLPILIPLNKWWEIPYMYIGTKFYEFFAGKSNNTPKSYYLSRDEALKQFPMLKGDNLKGAIVYFDGQMNDARHTLALALTAESKGAAIANYVAVEGLIKEGTIEQAADKESYAKMPVRGVVARDALTGKELRIRAKTVINATGPFSDAIRKMDNPDARPYVIPATGVHVVLTKKYCADKLGMLIPKTSDGRLLFLLPWENNTLVGTTDAQGELSDLPKPSIEDVDFIINNVKQYINTPIERSDVNAVWAGLRPLVLDPKAASKGTKSLSRQHLVLVEPSGLVSILGGKYTTYRKMAEDAVNAAVDFVASQPGGDNVFSIPLDQAKASVTFNMPLLGADKDGTVCASNYSTLESFLVKLRGAPPDVASHLVRNYGVRALHVVDYMYKQAEKSKTSPWKRLSDAHPYLETEVLYSVDCEAAQRLEDVLCRRTRLAFVDAAAANLVADKVANMMAEPLGWNAERKQSELARLDQVMRTMDVSKLQ